MSTVTHDFLSPGRSIEVQLKSFLEYRSKYSEHSSTDRAIFLYHRDVNHSMRTIYAKAQRNFMKMRSMDLGGYYDVSEKVYQENDLSDSSCCSSFFTDSGSKLFPLQNDLKKKYLNIPFVITFPLSILRKTEHANSFSFPLKSHFTIC